MRYWQLQLVLLAFFAGLVLIPRLIDSRAERIRSACSQQAKMPWAVNGMCAEFGR